MRHVLLGACVVVSLTICSALPADAPPKRDSSLPDKIYVPYEQLKGVFENEQQGVFLPYDDFYKLWRAAQGAPAGVESAPMPYLMSTARFTGKIEGELAVMQLDLTVDILNEGWVQIPIGLGQVAVTAVAFDRQDKLQSPPLLHIADGQYRLVVKGKGRYGLHVGFVCQLATQPGLRILNHALPSAAITTLDLLIPEENVRVDVDPMLAATTIQETLDGKPVTKLQAFLGSAASVKLSWRPKTQAAAELAAVVIADQFQRIDISEALISHEVRFSYDIRRRGIDALTIQLPSDFRVIGVEGANINQWDIVPIAQTNDSPAAQLLKVKFFSSIEGSYRLAIKMERFLNEVAVDIPLSPIVTQQVLRRTGLIAITHSPRRSVELRNAKNLARVDIGRLPEDLQQQPGVTAYRFITADYAGTLAIGTVRPRISADHVWSLGVHSDRLDLHGRLSYQVDRTGIFKLAITLPEPWQIGSVGPADVVEDHQFSGTGSDRTLTILLKKELTGGFNLDIAARAPRTGPEADVCFDLPLADNEDLHAYSGKLVLFLADQFRAEMQSLNQFQAIPLKAADKDLPAAPGLKPEMAFEFRSIDRAKPAGATLKIAVKPSQVSAVVYRLVNIQPGSIQQEAVIRYDIRYAPVDTFYLTLPADLADAGIEITGPDIKEKPRIDELPPDQQTQAPATQQAPPWPYYKVVLQSPVVGRYELKVNTRRSFQVDQGGQLAHVEVEPILAAGKLSDQNGYIAVAKADTFAIGQPILNNLIPADPGNAADLPYEPHRRIAALAFKYTTPPFALVLPVARQAEAAVFTTIVNGAIIGQVLARDDTLNTHAIYLLSTSRGDRLPITLPTGAKLFAVKLNGNEVPVEMGGTADERIVRLPPSAGQVAKVVLEISYGLDNASASKATAPALPQEIPTQQTLWQVWIPDESVLLAYNRVFAQLDPGQANHLFDTLARNQPSEVKLALAPQGRVWNFVRQGNPGELQLTLMDSEWFAVLVWAIVIVAGLAMLTLTGFVRSLIVLAIVFVGTVLSLFVPLFVQQFAFTALPAAGLVVALWLVQWLFVRLPKRRRSAAIVKTNVSKPQDKERTNEK